MSLREWRWFRPFCENISSCRWTLWLMTVTAWYIRASHFAASSNAWIRRTSFGDDNWMQSSPTESPAHLRFCPVDRRWRIVKLRDLHDRLFCRHSLHSWTWCAFRFIFKHFRWFQGRPRQVFYSLHSKCFPKVIPYNYALCLTMKLLQAQPTNTA